MASEVTEVEAPHATFDTILALDFGSQYTDIILRRLRELNIYCEILPCTAKLSNLKFKPKGLILSGGPASVYDADAPHVDPAFFELVISEPYELVEQEIAWRINSENVKRGEAREYGHADVTIVKTGNAHADRLFQGLGEEMHVYLSHFDKLVKLPEGFLTVAKTKNSEFAGIAHEKDPIFGIQFHPEVTHTPRGAELLRNFTVDICGAKPDWKMSAFIDQEISRIRTLVGPTASVIGAVSGGVDSTVAAKLMTEAIEHLGINLTVIDGGDRFLGALKDVVEPEKKRKIIGGLFIDMFEEEAIRIEKAAVNTPNAGKVSWFLQDTLYRARLPPKTHHNVGGLPERMERRLKLLEPLRELFKDEVRQIGRELGIDQVTPERVAIVRQADHIYISEIRAAGIYDEMSQAFAGLDSNRAVGVMGDQRVYGYICILRAICTNDFMTGTIYRFDWELLEKIARRITNEVDGISRVVYDTYFPFQVTEEYQATARRL
ncbi:hypothetical protein ACHAQH_005235 [Verticillium albo-atrum]